MLPDGSVYRTSENSKRLAEKCDDMIPQDLYGFEEGEYYDANMPSPGAMDLAGLTFSINQSRWYRCQRT